MNRSGKNALLRENRIGSFPVIFIITLLFSACAGIFSWPAGVLSKSGLPAENFHMKNFPVVSIFYSGDPVKAGAYPKKYDLRSRGLVTGVKDQGLTGSCWAFAAIKSAESNMMKQGLMNSPDFSENQLIWFSYHPSKDKSDPLYGDGIMSTQSRTSNYFPFPKGKNPLLNTAERASAGKSEADHTKTGKSAKISEIKKALNNGKTEKNVLKRPDLKGLFSMNASMGDTTCYTDGGSAMLAVFTMARWTGAVSESLSPFAGNTAAGIKNMASYMTTASGEALRYVSQAHLQNAVCYDGHGRGAIKRGILNNGAVDIGIYYNENYIARYKKPYYNYYQTKYKGARAYSRANHCITIIGWNDSYSKKNFKKKPPKNGAWLAMNSYGTKQESGLFYISYYDSSLCDAYNFQMEPADNYDYAYEYDGFGWGDYTTSRLGSIAVANKFRNNENNTQELRAVSLHTVASFQKCTIEIRTGTTGNPGTGTASPEATVTKTFRYPGYHTVKLPSYVTLAPGTDYSIIVKYYKNKKYYTNTYVPLEGSGMTTSGIKFSYHADKGQSYLKYKGKWYDMTELDYNNACIKGFTSVIG